MPYPHFICIGAQKAGTTWLYHQMKAHPDIVLSHHKELHYFDRMDDGFLLRSFFEKSIRGVFVRSMFLRLLKKRLWYWGWYYMIAKISVRNYSKLFRHVPGKVCGELTPAYARLKEEIIDELAHASPETKIIYLLRNPVDRVWSQVNMFYRTNAELRDKKPEEVIAYKQPMIYNNSHYTSNLLRWEKAFGREQVYVGFFDQIREQPEAVLTEVYSFLGISTGKGVLPDSIRVPRNKGNHGKIPPYLERELSEYFLPELEALHARFGNEYTGRWLNRAKAILGTGSHKES